MHLNKPRRYVIERMGQGESVNRQVYAKLYSPVMELLGINSKSSIQSSLLHNHARVSFCMDQRPL